jgi:hypothetical protein
MRRKRKTPVTPFSPLLSIREISTLDKFKDIMIKYDIKLIEKTETGFFFERTNGLLGYFDKNKKRRTTSDEVVNEEVVINKKVNEKVTENLNEEVNEEVEREAMVIYSEEEEVIEEVNEREEVIEEVNEREEVIEEVIEEIIEREVVNEEVNLEIDLTSLNLNDGDSEKSNEINDNVVISLETPFNSNQNYSNSTPIVDQTLLTTLATPNFLNSTPNYSNSTPIVDQTSLTTLATPNFLNSLNATSFFAFAPYLNSTPNYLDLNFNSTSLYSSLVSSSLEYNEYVSSVTHNEMFDELNNLQHFPMPTKITNIVSLKEKLLAISDNTTTFEPLERLAEKSFEELLVNTIASEESIIQSKERNFMDYFRVGYILNDIINKVKNETNSHEKTITTAIIRASGIGNLFVDQKKELDDSGKKKAYNFYRVSCRVFQLFSLFPNPAYVIKHSASFLSSRKLLRIADQDFKGLIEDIKKEKVGPQFLFEVFEDGLQNLIIQGDIKNKVIKHVQNDFLPIEGNSNYVGLGLRLLNLC